MRNQLESEILEAVYSGDEHRVRVLSRNGVSLSQKYEGEETLLHIACGTRNASMVKLLLDLGSNPKIANADGETPLIRACMSMTSDTPSSDGLGAMIVPILISAGCDLDAQDVTGTSALIAAAHSKIKTVEALLRHRPNLDLQCDSEDTALTVAIQWENTDAANMLITAGARFDIEDKNGWCALAYAIQCRNLPVIESLVSHGDDMRKPTRKLGSHLDFARQNGIDPKFIDEMAIRYGQAGGGR